MNWLRWRRGRQGTGYEKLLLCESKFLKFDCYILRYKVGSKVPYHKDPVKSGKHFRLNIILQRAKKGGGFLLDNKNYPSGRVVLFRPDIESHAVQEILEGTRIVLSIGWIKK